MKKQSLTRRELLVRGSFLTLGAAVSGLPTNLLAADLAALDVAYAGSMGSMMEGPIKASAAQNFKLDFRGRAQGSSALAQLIVFVSIRPDVFFPCTSGPALTLLPLAT